MKTIATLKVIVTRVAPGPGIAPDRALICAVGEFDGLPVEFIGPATLRRHDSLIVTVAEPATSPVVEDIDAREELDGTGDPIMGRAVLTPDGVAVHIHRGALGAQATCFTCNQAIDGGAAAWFVPGHGLAHDICHESTDSYPAHCICLCGRGTNPGCPVCP